MLERRRKCSRWSGLTFVRAETRQVLQTPRGGDGAIIAAGAVSGQVTAKSAPSSSLQVRKVSLIGVLPGRSAAKQAAPPRPGAVAR